MTTHSVGQTGSGPLARLVPAVATGIVGGLAGGVVFGVLMQMMDMIPMVAKLVGSDSMAVGWLVHLAISAFIGASFAVLLGRWAGKPVIGAALGMGYGVIWWVLGALLIMPAKLGMTDMIFQIGKTQWQSLMGHLMFGLILGLAYALIAPRLARRG